MLVILRGGASLDLAKKLPSIKLSIFRRIMSYPYKAEDMQLSKYLKKNFKLTLRSAALYVYRHIDYNINQDNDIVITTTNHKADKLARIINYGTITSGKSNILKYAFAKK